jgi:hypothetical protein
MAQGVYLKEDMMDQEIDELADHMTRILDSDPDGFLKIQIAFTRAAKRSVTLSGEEEDESPSPLSH